MIIRHYTHAQLENLANDLNQRYDARRLKTPSQIDVYDIVDLLGARLSFEYLSPDRTILGATVFRDALLPVWPGNPYVDGMMPTEKRFYKGTIIIDRSLNESTKKRDTFSENFTVMHECFHFKRHSQYFQNNGYVLTRFTEYALKQKDNTDSLSRIEHQANYAAAAFLMPSAAVEYGARRWLQYRRTPLPFGYGIKDDIKELGYRFGVNYTPMVYRLQNLGILTEDFNPFI